MAIFSSTITDLVANKTSQPYYRFDGVNDVIDMGDVTFIDSLKEFSVSIWFKAESDANTNTVIFSKDNQIECWIKWNGNVRYALSVNNDHVDFTSSATPLGEWVHVVYTWTMAGDSRKVYQNGVLIQTASGNENGEKIQGGADALSVGARTAGSYPTNGEISNVRFYNKELTAAEILEIYGGASVPWNYRGAKLIRDQPYSGTTGGWNVYGTNTLVTDPDYLKMNGNGSNANGFYHYFDGDSFNVEKGKKYDVAITARVDTSGDNISFGFANAANYQSPNTVSSLTWTETSFTRKSFEFTALDDGTAGNTYLYGAGTFGNGEVLEIDTMEMYQIGLVAEWDGSGIASDKWFDKSGNDYHGSVSGATAENTPSGVDGLVYEEGTWTPNFYGTGGGSTQFSSEGRYTRIGNQVTCRFDKSNFNWSSGYSGALHVGGLPFTGEANSNHLSCATDAYYYPASTWQSTNECGILFLKNSADSTLYCRVRDVAGDSDTGFDASRLNSGTNTYFGFMFTYHV